LTIFRGIHIIWRFRRGWPQQLTGLILPDFKLVSVKSRANYWGQARQSRRTPLDGSRNDPSQ